VSGNYFVRQALENCQSGTFAGDGQSNTAGSGDSGGCSIPWDGYRNGANIQTDVTTLSWIWPSPLPREGQQRFLSSGATQFPDEMTLSSETTHDL
jgi:hypothetical protein